MLRVVASLVLLNWLVACDGKVGQANYPRVESANAANQDEPAPTDSDSKNSDKLGNLEVETPLLFCGIDKSCYQDSTAMNARAAVTPSGKVLELKKNARGVELWMEKDGRRILRADGMDQWQMRLSLDGKSYSGIQFEDKDRIAGRACPPNVYINDLEKFAKNRCLYYDAADTVQMDLNISGASQSISGSVGLAEWSLYNNGEPRWYVGNVQECAKHGMRLPALFETNFTGDTAPTGNFPYSDGTPEFAREAGVISLATYYVWSATAAKDHTGYYSTWRGAEVVNQHYTFEKSVLCVLP